MDIRGLGVDADPEHLTLKPVTVILENLRVLEDEQAARRLADSEFEREWEELWRACPWATAAQDPRFVRTWYACYSASYRPLVLTRRAAGTGLDGLMLLAEHRVSGRLTFAGAEQAEYHVWLARAGDDTFVVQALDALKHRGHPSLTFLFLPPRAPTHWLEGRWSRCSHLRKARRPLMEIGDGSGVRDSLKKKSNRSRLNQLKRMGDFEFLQLRSAEQLDEHLSEIAAFTDLRQGAVNGSFPFLLDGAKRPFFRALANYPGLTHATVTLVGGRVAAAHVGFENRGEVILGLIAHSPFVAQQSPGKLHLLHLGLLLAEQGISALDLTPGGDAYKERFATRADHAHVLTVFLNRRALVWHHVRRRLTSVVKTTLARVGVEVESVERAARRAVQGLCHPVTAVGDASRIARRWLWSRSEMHLYRLDRSSDLSANSEGASINRNSIEDLLAYRGSGRSGDRQEFCMSAMRRLESGEHVFTETREVLTRCLWASEDANEAVHREMGESFGLAERSWLLSGFYADSRASSQSSWLAFLAGVLRCLERGEERRPVYVVVPSEHIDLRRDLEALRFQRVSTVWRRVWLGRVASGRGCDPPAQTSGKSPGSARGRVEGTP